MIRAAKGYVERLGFRLVVADAEKRPLARFFPRGVNSATTDIERVERALRSCSNATLAARIGEHVVLDIDTRHGGHEAMERLLASFGSLPRTWEARTPSGGAHIWFRGIPTETKGTLCTGVEVLRGNRLVTLAPSQRAGGRYEWVQRPLQTPLAELPRWIVDAITLPPLPTRQLSTTNSDPASRERRARSYLMKFEPAISGQHGHARTFLAAQIAVRGFELEPETALSVLNEWNARCDPPWSERDLRRKVREAIRRGRLEWGAMVREREGRAA